MPLVLPKMPSTTQEVSPTATAPTVDKTDLVLPKMPSTINSSTVSKNGLDLPKMTSSVNENSPAATTMSIGTASTVSAPTQTQQSQSRKRRRVTKTGPVPSANTVSASTVSSTANHEDDDVIFVAEAPSPLVEQDDNVIFVRSTPIATTELPGMKVDSRLSADDTQLDMALQQAISAQPTDSHCNGLFQFRGQEILPQANLDHVPSHVRPFAGFVPRPKSQIGAWRQEQIPTVLRFSRGWTITDSGLVRY